ncbi:MAG TPA: hypothetical protein VFE47_04080 [Tepidisphaeraceae bacterium]|jgi:hypothetical protein|nr:hypothetical protein [Tepidisphaeraceae bacterium]
MAHVTIDLSESDLLKAQENSRARGYATVEAYVEAVLKRRLNEEMALEDSEQIPVPKGRLKALIEEGLASPSKQRTKADFERIREEIIDRNGGVDKKRIRPNARMQESTEEDHGVPTHLCVSSAEQFKALVREGLSAPGQTYNANDMAEMRKELIERGRISNR